MIFHFKILFQSVQRNYRQTISLDESEMQKTRRPLNKQFSFKENLKHRYTKNHDVAAANNRTDQVQTNEAFETDEILTPGPNEDEIYVDIEEPNRLSRPPRTPRSRSRTPSVRDDVSEAILEVPDEQENK